MASSFAQLMALSASQTQQSQSEVQNALAERQRKQEQQRRLQEERERKEREQEAKIRLRKLQEKQREEERAKRLEEERAAKERERERREEEQRNHLLGTKKPREYPSSSAGSASGSARDDGRRRRNPGSDDDSPLSGASVLTREEKRARKEQAAYRRAFISSKRSVGGSPSKAGRRLPGGAIDMTADSGSSSSGSQARSAKERIMAAPNTLTKLNTVKRDTRTIDEILADRAKAKVQKVLDGDEAREFNDWFGTKKKEVAKPHVISPPRSGAASPAPNSSEYTPHPPLQAYADILAEPSSLPNAPAKKPAPTKSPAAVPRSAPTPSSRPPPFLPKAGSSTKPKLATKAAASVDKSTSARGSSGSAPTRKRTRSTSLSDDDLDSYESDSPPPPKRRGTADVPQDLGLEIWKLFGKDKRTYLERDIMSDDEDMEVDAAFLEREEKRRYAVPVSSCILLGAQCVLLQQSPCEEGRSGG